MAVTEQQLTTFLDPWQRLWNAFRDDPAAWVWECVRTRNEDARPGEQRERVPLPDLPHLRVLVWAWYAVKLLQVDKARQMMATWWLNFMMVHEAMFVPSANIGYQHMTSADTAGKLEKYFLYVLTNQPLAAMLPWVEERGHPPDEWIQLMHEEFGLSLTPDTPPRPDQPATFGSEAYHFARKVSNRYRTKSGPEGVEEIILEPFFEADPRYVTGIPAGPKGPNKWRGDTRTRACEDEAWFHQALADNVNSAKQSVGQNGRQTLITTASLGEDGDAYPLKMIEKAPRQPEEFGGFGGFPALKASELPEGVEMWLTTMGYTHLRIHHYADPAKRGDDWVKNNVYVGDIRKNQREILIRYNAPSGEPFYPSFDYMRQRARLDDTEGASLYLFADGGRRPAFGAAFVYPNGRVHVFLEMATQPGSTSNVKSMATAFRGLLHRTALTRELWRRADLVCDPSMFDTRGETDDVTSADILLDLGFNPVKGAQNPDVRYQAVTNLNLLTIDEPQKRPALLIDSEHCPLLFEAMSGACVITRNAERTGQNSKEKNAFSHIVDALEYLGTYLDANPYSGDHSGDFLPVQRPRR